MKWQAQQYIQATGDVIVLPLWILGQCLRPSCLQVHEPLLFVEAANDTKYVLQIRLSLALKIPISFSQNAGQYVSQTVRRRAVSRYG